MTDQQLVGRESELAELDRFLQRCATGSHVLQIEGTAGVGKTALWQEGLVAARRRSCVVLTARPVEIETKLSFAGLSDLLEPVVDDVLQELPVPQRRAFEVALLIAPSRAQPDPRGVAAAFLSALRVLARDRQVLVAIDDLQWLDSSSHQIAAFAARRLGAEPVGFLVTRRTADADSPALELERVLSPDRFRRVLLCPLTIVALHRLIEADLGNAVPRPLLRRIYEISGGNPFFALEQARALRESGLHLDSGRELPVPPTLRSLVEERLARIPVAERDVLLAVAALAAPTRELLVSLVGAADNGWPPLIDAFESKIVEVVDGQIRFTHPLLRSVLYADTPLPARQALHRRLAELVHDPEESARHLALAIDAPSENVASRLEAASRFAEARGAPSSAGELLELAIGLTPLDDRSTLCRRHLEAGQRWAAAGDMARSVAQCERAVAVSPPGSDRVVALTHLGRATAHSGDCRAAAVLFARALEEPCDDARACVSLECELVWNEHMLGDLRAAEQRAHNAVRLARALGERAVLVETLAGLGLIQMLRRREGYRSTLDRALVLERDERASRLAADDVEVACWWMADWQNAMTLAWAGELDAAHESLEAVRRRAVERGDEQAMPFVVTWLSRVAFLKDDWQSAAEYAEEGYEASISAPAERVFALAPRAMVAGHLGDVEAAREATDEGFRLAEQTGMVSARIEHAAIRGGLEFSLGDLAAAHRLLAPLPGELERHGFAEPAIFRFHPDLIETLVASGEIAAAKEQLAELEGIAGTVPALVGGRGSGSVWRPARC